MAAVLRASFTYFTVCSRFFHLFSVQYVCNTVTVGTRREVCTKEYFKYSTCLMLCSISGRLKMNYSSQLAQHFCITCTLNHTCAIITYIVYPQGIHVIHASNRILDGKTSKRLLSKKLSQC